MVMRLRLETTPRPGFVPRLLAVLLAGIALLGCEKTSWHEVVRLPRDQARWCGSA